MLTDAMLREAAAEAARFLLSLEPEEDGEPHVFSKRFERKMEKLFRRVNHPVRYQVMRAAATIVLVIATLFGAVMAFSPEARAAVVGWVKSAFYEFFEYSNHASDANMNSSANEQTVYEYRLSVVPDGYRELKLIERKDGKGYLYADEMGRILQFTYTYGGESSGLFTRTEEYIQHTDYVHEWLADVYIALKKNESSVIVWQDPDANVLFQIFAAADQNELIEIAETVEKIQS